MIYRIAKWHEVFERAESRKLKVLSWVAIPTSFSSHGYQCLLDEFGDDAAAIYGAWCALVSVAASCTVRGTLANSRGMPLPITHLVRMTGFPHRVFEELIEWAGRPEICWLEKLDRVQPEENTDFSPQICETGESPDDPPAHQEAAGGIPRIHDKTRQDQTGQDITRQDKTRQDKTAAVGRPVQSGPVVDFGSLSGRVEELRDMLQRFPVKSIDRELAWRVVCLDAITRNGFASSIADSFRGSRGVKKPASFVNRAIVKHCDENRIDHAAFLRAVPQNESSVARSARDEMREHVLAKSELR